MTCFQPLHRFFFRTNFYSVSKDNELFGTGKDKFIVTSGKQEEVKLQNGEVLKNYQEIPCGHCIGCRLEYAKQWANRCMLEAKLYKNNEMLTLTYNEEHLPITDTIVDIDGNIIETGTLNKKDLQDFMKRLRIEWKRKYGHDNIKFYACGEYGDLNGRPHYHILLFNMPIFDKEIDHNNKKGNVCYNSKEIEKIWGKGRIAINDFCWETANYVARYVMKKQKGKNAKEFYEKAKIEPEFVRMSNRPGIAKGYYDKNKENIYLTDEIFIPTNNGTQSIKPSRYFDKLYDIDNPEKMEEIKENRKKIAEERENLEMSRTTIKKEMYLKIKETKQKSKIRNLTRAEI